MRRNRERAPPIGACMDPFIAILILLLAPLVILACLDSKLSREAEAATLQFFTSGGREKARNPNSSGR